MTRGGILNGLAISHFNDVAICILLDACSTSLCHAKLCILTTYLSKYLWYHSATVYIGIHASFLLAASANLPWQKLERRHGLRAPSPKHATTGRAYTIIPGRQVLRRYVFIEPDRP
jgi:hypothetical protein